MPRVTLFFILIMFVRLGYAQETSTETHSLGGGIVETYRVLNSDQKLKQGPYLMATRKNVPIAAGTYKQGQRIGTWTFYDKNGKTQEIFNYATNALMFEAPPTNGQNYITYSFEQKTGNKDTVTKPVKIGGIYFGYMPYVKLAKVDGTFSYSSYPINAYLTIQINPNGNLVDCKLLIKLKNGGNLVDTYPLNSSSLDDYDRQFLPATINHKPVASTISVWVNIDKNDWTVNLF